MKIAIMQPYFLPYIGYFQLVNAVDRFVVYDNIQYTKKGWITRNRILLNGRETMISLPVKKASDYLDIVDRELGDSWQAEKIKLLNRISSAYCKAPEFDKVYRLVQDIVECDDRNLFDFIHNSLRLVFAYLNIQTPIVISSSLDVDVELKGQDRVIATCKILDAKQYLNPVGGLELYSRKEFEANGIDLGFLRTGDLRYSQPIDKFIPFLSILDVLMYSPDREIRKYLNTSFELL